VTARAARWVSVRLVAGDDVPAVTELLLRSRGHLALWEPLHDDSSTEASQRASVAALLERHAAGTHLPLDDVVRGAFPSAATGSWVDARSTGRGVATAAVAATARLAFGELGLHRSEASTPLHHTASQRVLARNGSTRVGTAPRCVRIAGRWQDHHLRQLLDEEAPR